MSELKIIYGPVAVKFKGITRPITPELEEAVAEYQTQIKEADALLAKSLGLKAEAVSDLKNRFEESIE